MNQNVTLYLEKEPVGKLMLRFSIPCIMSLLVSALYNIVDQIFIGRGVGYLGNGATNVVFPITIIALAISLLIGDGCAAYLSICQGMKDQERSHKSVGNAVTIIVLSSLVLTFLFTFLQDKMLWAFGATDNNINYAQEYFRYIVLGIPFYMFANAMNSVIRADGSPKFAMISTLVGCIINVILDPLAIFVFHWGMKGAAIATIIGQIVSALLAVYYLFHTKTFRLKKESFLPHAKLLGHTLPLSISRLLTQISIVIIMIVMKVFQIVISIMVGIAAGSQPIVGYNYGAGLYKRVRQLFQTMMAVEACVGIIAMICFKCFPLQIIGIFGSEDEYYNEFAVLSFRIFLSTIALCCIQKSCSIFLQSLGKPVMSMSLSLLRDFILSVPLALLLPRFLGVTGALYSAPIADIISFIAALFCMRKMLQHLKTEETATTNTEAVVAVKA